MSLHISSTVCSSSGGKKLYYTASGIITHCRWPSRAQVEGGPTGVMIPNAEKYNFYLDQPRGLVVRVSDY